jgi:hypothetical protein
MKKLILATAVCFAFSMHATAACQNANLKTLRGTQRKNQRP